MDMRRFKNLFCVLLLLLAVAAVSCETKKEASPPKEPGDAAEATEGGTVAETPVLPEGTYGGRVIKIAAASETLWGNELICPEAEDGEQVNDATFRRNKTVEDLFDVNLVQVDINFMNFEKTFQNSVMAGDNIFDFAFPRLYHAVPLAAGGYLADFGGIPYVDPGRPWWDYAIVRDLSLAGRSFFLAGDINMYAYDGTFVMAFNKRLHRQLGLENLYELVLEGKWTIDRLDTVMRAATSDLDGNGKMDFYDQFGLYANDVHSIVSLITAFDCNMFEKTAESEITFDITRERFVVSIEKINRLMNEGGAVFDGTNTKRGGNLPSGEWNYAQKVFSDGRALFMHQVLDTARMNRGMEDDFGLLPVPKFDEAQKEYFSPINDGVYVLVAPATLPPGDAEMLGGIMEAMAYEGQKQIIPAYYDKTLLQKNARDEESEQMLDIVFRQRRYSLDEAYNFGGMKDKIVALTRSNSSDVNSLSEKNAAAVQTAIDKLLDQYAALGAK